MYCWLAAGCLLLLLSFSFSYHSISFHLISSHFISFHLWWLNMSNGEGSSRSYSFWNRNGSKSEVSKGIKTSSKKQPQKSWTTLFTTPFINHFREWAHFIYHPFINRYPTLHPHGILENIHLPFENQKNIYILTHLPPISGFHVWLRVCNETIGPLVRNAFSQAVAAGEAATKAASAAGQNAVSQVGSFGIKVNLGGKVGVGCAKY